MSILDINDDTSLISFDSMWEIKPTKWIWGAGDSFAGSLNHTNRICAWLMAQFSKNANYWSALLTKSCAIASYYTTSSFGMVMPEIYASVITELTDGLRSILSESEYVSYTLRFANNLASRNMFISSINIGLSTNPNAKHYETCINICMKTIRDENGGAIWPQFNQYIDTKKWKRSNKQIFPPAIPQGWVNINQDIIF